MFLKDLLDEKDNKIFFHNDFALGLKYEYCKKTDSYILVWCEPNGEPLKDNKDITGLYRPLFNEKLLDDKWFVIRINTPIKMVE